MRSQIRSGKSFEALRLTPTIRWMWFAAPGRPIFPGAGLSGGAALRPSREFDPDPVRILKLHSGEKR
jgi:hypothetical protein